MSKLQIIDAGWLIDGSAKPIRTKVQLRIINGSIETIRENQPIRSGQTPDNSDAQTLDLNDATILPATFIAFKENPAGLPDNLRQLLGVWVKGKRIG